MITSIVTPYPDQPLQKGYPRLQCVRNAPQRAVLFVSEFSGICVAGGNIGTGADNGEDGCNGAAAMTWISADDAGMWAPCTVQMADGDMWEGVLSACKL